MAESAAEKQEREQLLLRRTMVILLRDAARLEQMAKLTAGTRLAGEFAAEAVVARRLAREVRKLADRWEAQS